MNRKKVFHIILEIELGLDSYFSATDVEEELTYVFEDLGNNAVTVTVTEASPDEPLPNKA